MTSASSSPLPAPSSHSDIHDVYPYDANVAFATQYAVMILDVRGSTKQLSRPNSGPSEAARRVHRMLASVNEILEGVPPNFLKSTGDGFFCVWELKRDELYDAQLRILKAAYRIYSDLPGKLKYAEPGVGVDIGVGLTFGTLAHYKDDLVNDYFGYFANLAAKLQDAARPHGLIVDAAPLSLWPQALRDELDRLDLKYHRISASSPLHGFELRACYATSTVKLAHNWTCLAWPGFATAQEDSHPGFDPLSFGLNTRGITVITHEGLQGKIGTLAISRAFQSDSRGEHFQIYIDDYDALAMLHAQGQVALLAVDESLSNVKVKLSGALTSTCSERNFTFIPVRCGINGLAANADFPWSLSDFSSYEQLLDRIESAEDGDLSLDEVALYENVGATLPILVMAANPSYTHRDVLDNADYQALERTRDRLVSLVKKKRQSFSRYSRIHDLAIALGNGTIKLVIGGGAWLAPPGLPLLENLSFSVPKESGAFLWIEGAALHSSASDAPALLGFLSDSVLSEEFQSRLPSFLPYPACPCTIGPLKTILNSATLDGASGLYIAEETKRAFQTPSRLQKNISIRRAPAKNPEEWTEIFTEILQNCCLPKS